MTTLSHVNIRTAKYEETIAFYEFLLEFRRAISPVNPDPNQNTWLLDPRGNACVHVNALKAHETQRPADSCLDHIAFNYTGDGRIRDRLAQQQVPFDEVQTLVPQVVQLRFRDPNGIRVELILGHEFLRPVPLAND